MTPMFKKYVFFILNWFLKYILVYKFIILKKFVLDNIVKCKYFIIYLTKNFNLLCG